MNILLTGGTGYIGSHTAVALTQAGHQIVLLDNYSNSRPEVGDRLARILGQPVAQVECDVRDTARLAQTLRQHTIEAVIHFAGLKAVGESVTRPLDYYAHNVQGTISLLQAMRAIGVNILVFSSSATVYGEPRYLPIDEQHPLAAANPYGRCKLHIEAMLGDVARADSAWRIACLRYFNPIGAHESGLIGEGPRDVPNNLAPFIAQVASGAQPWLNIFGNDYPTPDGTGVRDYIHVMDLAEGHQAALAALCAGMGKSSQPDTHLITVNLGTGRGYSVLEVVETFAAVSGRAIPYRFAPRRPGDIAACHAEVSRAARLLGWRARRGLWEMCASAWTWQVRSRDSSPARAAE
ncbi:MAG: UDP-glucose 4-epimerase GalE [Candidatus Contendobacter sp.]|nr:UDP-glucose 4-epimerase GalE [Candidatus Contendobacter sp.]